MCIIADVVNVAKTSTPFVCPIDTADLQFSVDNLSTWAVKLLLNFNGQKCKALHLGKSNHHHKYYMQHRDEKTELNSSMS